MDKNISEMSLEELQDYALNLRSVIDVKDKELDDLKADKVELQNLNKTLQKRNNELFMRVEQPIQSSTEGPAELPTVESCEEFAQNLKL